MKPIFEIRSLFILMALVLIGSIGMAYRAGRVTIALAAESQQREGFVNGLEALLSTMKDAETGQRGFLLTGKEDYLDPYTNSLNKVHQDLATLRQTAHEIRPAAEQELETLEKQAEAKLEELQETVNVRQREGLERALARVNTDEGKRLFDEMRDTVKRLENDENKSIAEADLQINRARAARNLTFACTTLLNLAFLLWAYLKISRGTAVREAAALEIRRQKEVLATTLSSIGDAVIIADTSSRITFLNGVAEELTGWSSAEAVGQPCANVFNIVNESTRRPVESPVDKVLQTGLIIGLANHTLLIRKDLSEVPIDDSGAPIREPGGQMRGVVLVFRDFSAHKETERALREAKEQVERASEGKDLFLAALSHELRTPLSPVLAILSEWQDDSNFPAALKPDLTMIRRNVTLEARLIDDLLDLTRIDRGTLSLNPERVNLHDLVTATMTIFEADIQAKRLHIHLDLEASQPWVTGDPVRLQQVLWNIMGNAVKFTPAHGTLTLSSRHPSDDTVEIEVTDSGIGLSAQTLENLFSPFYQGGYQEGRKFGGLGLGMAISKALIEQHNGLISAESQGSGQGASFSIVLPVAGASPMLPPHSTAENTTLPPLDLLLVEDHVDTARSISA
ncbi:MAG: domain S-box, partial [Verrucomicrobiaceae bacterium]|nr:domain S-box [Verrucomicrobiaceae bacterium]